jgi:hypothetical protein
MNTLEVQEKHPCSPENADTFRKWISDRGGIAVWKSINLSNPGASWSSPALTEDGQPYPKPTWQAENKPSRIITDPADVVVEVPREVKRFRVAIRLGSQGMSYKLTDASSRKVENAVSKAAGRDGREFSAWYEFDYDTQQAVILVADKSVPLSEFDYARHVGYKPEEILANLRDRLDNPVMGIPDGEPNPRWILSRATVSLHPGHTFPPAYPAGASTRMFDPEVV